MIASPDWPPKIMMLRQMRPGLAGIARALVPSARSRPTRMSDDAVVAERHDRLAGARVDLLEEAVDGEDQAAILAVGALPVVDALAGDAVQPLVHPELLAGRGVERDERRRVAAEAVEHAVGEHRAEGRRGVRIEPGHLELGDVGLVDLIERVEVGAVGSGQRLDGALRGRHAEPDGRHESGGHRDRRMRRPRLDRAITRVLWKGYAGPYVAGTVARRQRAGKRIFENQLLFDYRSRGRGTAACLKSNRREGDKEENRSALV